jgi:hypothetical protein
MSDKYNVNELTSGELKLHARNARQAVIDNDPCVYFEPDISGDSTPQFLRRWLITNFPHDYYDGKTGKGMIFGARKNRGIGPHHK